MKYIITEVFFGKQGGIVFDTAHGVEVFDHYVSALRYLVKEKRISQKVDDKVVVQWYDDRFGYGRQKMLEMIEWYDACHTIITLSKINENGFH